MDCWHREIDRASTEDEVVARAKDYLVLWAPSELEPLVRSERTLQLEDGADIVRYQRRLAEGYFEARCSPPRAEQFQELSSYFWHAAARIREIRRAV
jgi:hypothetical protein